MVLVSLERRTSLRQRPAAARWLAFDLPELIAAAEERETSEARGLMLRDGKLFVVVVVPC